MPGLSPAIEAVGLQLRTRRGRVYGPLDLTLARGEIAMLVGAAGSGKTALLLTLTGRMRPSGGTLRLMGLDAVRDPAAVRARTAMGLVPGLNDLSEPLSVRDTVRAELAMLGLRATPQRLDAVVAPMGLDADDTRVGDLGMGQRALLGVALALAAKPDVLAVDAIDDALAPEERAALLAALRDVASSGVAIVGACIDPGCARGADVALEMAPSVESEVSEDAVA